MMKNRLLFFILLNSILSFAQQRNEIVLNWTDNVKSFISDTPIVIPQFQGEYFDFDADRKVMYFRQNFKVSAYVAENSLQVTNITYETVTREQLGSLSAGNQPVAINPKISTSNARGELYATVMLSPIIKEGSGFKRIKSFTYTYSFGAAPLTALGVNDFDQIANSVLASGQWYRFYVEKSGVYKISKSFLQQLGLDVSADPRNIKIYGNGGRMIPLKNSVAYPSDLAENAIRFIGEEDGSFDTNDYILFYAEGLDNWSAENGSHNNLYADKSYYYVTAQGGTGKRMGQMGQPAAATLNTSVFDEYQYHEEDLINIARLGRKWHGEAFNINNKQQFEFVVPDIELSPVTIKVSTAANAVIATSFTVKANGQSLGTQNIPALAEHVGAMEQSPLVASYTPTGNVITIELTYNNNGAPGSNGWLDYIILQAKRKLQGNGKQFRFQYNDAATSNGVLQYNFSNASGISEVWDVTDIYNTGRIVNEGLQSQFSFKATLGEIRKYVTVVPADYYTPLRDAQVRVANQNIKGTIFNNASGQFQDIDYIIVTPANLNSSAEKLAALHRQEGLNVKVVNLENIYQEFSSGKQDVGAIRNLIKYVYYNASSADKRIKYVNLFGDASFDYKNRVPNNTNIVPTIQRYDAGNTANFSVVTTYATDDFYGFMDPEEGDLPPPSSNIAEALDIAVGRMVVDDKKQADEMVNKVAEYINAEAYNRWRNEFIVMADDLDGDGSTGFVPQLDALTVNLVAAKPFVNVRKIYIDAYVQQASAGGQRYPDAKEQFIRSINYGALVVTYLGHGGEDGMSGERIYEKTDADNLTNTGKYPLFITASCEISKFDNPYRPTVGEYTYWNPKGGAISMISTTRALFISDAYAFSPRLVQELYAYGSNDYPTMGEALRRAKVGLNNKNLRMIFLIGDPALKLAIPKPQVKLTTVNDISVADFTGALNSLAYVKLGGRVVNESDATITGYNGELEVTIFDKNMDRVTLGNDGVLGGPNNQLIITQFKTLGETIFRGNASVVNGQFEFGFVVPKDIRVPIANGRISFYSKRANVLEDQYGYNDDIKVGGVNLNAEADTTPPTVRLYMNDQSFVSGGITNASPILLAFLEDEHGINTASGIGHDILGVLDGDENNPYIMNDYYQTDVDNYKKGSLRFPFSNLAKGLHTLVFKAWDVYNNLVTAEIQFVVVGDEGLTLDKVLNYPNPFVSYTEFWFTHNRPFEPLDVQVQIFTITGKVVKTINQSVTTDGFLCRDVKWDGKDDFGDRIGKGVYVYKLTVRSTTTNKTAEKYEKLVLL